MAFLRLFEAKALAEALTLSGYSVSERTVQRWKAGTTKVQPQDIAAIWRVLERDNEEAAPQWAKRMDEKLSAVQTTVDGMAAALGAYVVAGEAKSSPSRRPGDAEPNGQQSVGRGSERGR